tara:strand:- start:20566 stop:20916 length:351 start_codon:yes stop_codon:yes gene_type:complete
MAKNIKLLKLITGEEVLAEILLPTGAQPVRLNDLNDIHRTYSQVTIKNVLRIVILPGRDPSAPSVGLAGWAQFAKDDEITVDRSHIIAIMEPIDQFVEQYRQQFSGLVTPPTQLII